MSDAPSTGPASTGLPLAASLDGPAGKPVLVLGPSLGTAREVWDPQVPALAAHFRLLRYDLPGHARPPARGAPRDPATPPGPYSVAGLGLGVLALLDRHGLDRVHYAGISIGGMIGMWLAARAPGRIAALGLCCTSAHLPPAKGEGEGGWLARAEQVRSAGMTSITEQSLGRWFTEPFVRACPATVAAHAATLAAVEPEGYAGCCEAIAAMDLRPLLGSITAPALVIAGSEDPATPPAHGALIASQIHAARLRVIRGAAHLANVQAHGQVTAALLAHLTAVNRADGEHASPDSRKP
ncbi:MAG: alpha/beta fold hydrolase [Streptosporangiaceae bacterium]